MTTDTKTHLWALFTLVALMVPLLAWIGFVIAQIWSMFVVPIGVPSIDVWQAAGLFLLCRFIVTRSKKGDEDKKITPSAAVDMVLAKAFEVGLLWLAASLVWWAWQ